MNANFRATKTPAELGLAAAYASARARLPGGADFLGRRDKAFQLFETHGLPNRRVEEWKYTDLRARWEEAKPLAAAPVAGDKAKAKNAGSLFASVDARRLVFVDGAFAPELSDLVPEPGLAIGSMADALAKGDPLVAQFLGKTVVTQDIAVALNTALMSDGALVRVAAGTRIARPVHLVYFGAQAKTSALRSLVVVENEASLTLIESHESAYADTNAVLELVVGDGARLDHVKTIQSGGIYLSSLLSRVGRRATFNTFSFTTKSALVRNQFFCRFDGDGSDSTIGGASLLRGKEHVDNTLVIEHTAPGCTSRERFRSVLDGQSHGVFQGKITVAQAAQQTDAKMASHALLLSDDAEASHKPELEIFADDVQCGHGATAGALQEDLLFYLRSRGVPRREAEALLVQAFISETIESIADDTVREALLGAAQAWLGERA